MNAHHCSRELDWLSSVRLHPVNDIVSRVVGAAPTRIIGQLLWLVRMTG